LEGNLNTNGTLPTQVTNITSGQDFYTSNGTGGVTGTAPTGATPLSSLADATGALYFQNGDVLTLTGKMGSRLINAKTMTITPATTLADMQSFMTGTLGIN